MHAISEVAKAMWHALTGSAKPLRTRDDTWVTLRLQELRYGQRLLLVGDRDCRFIWAVRDLVREGVPVEIPEDVMEETQWTLDRFGARGADAVCDIEKTIVKSVTLALLKSPADEHRQLLYVAALGTAHLVDHLLERGVVPIRGFEDNSVLETAAAMGNIDVVKCLVRANYAPVSMYSVQGMGQPPVDAVLKVIQARQRVGGIDGVVARHWEVVNVLVSKEPGCLATCRLGAVVVTAPLPLFTKIAAQEGAFMTSQAPAMAAHLVHSAGNWSGTGAGAGAAEWNARTDVVKTFLSPEHPLKACVL